MLSYDERMRRLKAQSQREDRHRCRQCKTPLSPFSKYLDSLCETCKQKIQRWTMMSNARQASKFHDHTPPLPVCRVDEARREWEHFRYIQIELCGPPGNIGTCAQSLIEVAKYNI